jgi:hypothetical protein
MCAAGLVSCSFSSITISTEPPEQVVLETPSVSEPTKPVQKPTLIPLQIPTEYPQSPEAVVQAFMAAYQADPVMMPLYLSSGIRHALPEGGIIELLGFDGVLEGFSLESAAVQLDPPFALIGVQVQVSGEVSYRGFNLSHEQDRWVIDSISFSTLSN